mgnify:CR=1 FL=1
MSSLPAAVSEPRTELTASGIVLGVVTTVLLRAENDFFGPTAGLSFWRSIPPAGLPAAARRRR